jgi:excisionase family DNA binding protein
MRLSVDEAAKIMGVSKPYIRIGLQRGLLPFGTAVKMTGNRYTYFISKNRFYEYLRIYKTEYFDNGGLENDSHTVGQTGSDGLGDLAGYGGNQIG